MMAILLSSLIDVIWLKYGLCRLRCLVNDQLTAQGVELRNGNQELDEAVQFLHDYG